MRSSFNMSHIQQTAQHRASDIQLSPDNRLNVGFVITRSDVIGGAQVHVRDLARRLLAEGHNATVLVGGEGPLTSDFDRLHIPWTSIPSLCQSIRPERDVRGSWGDYPRATEASPGYRLGAYCQGGNIGAIRLPLVANTGCFHRARLVR